MSELSIEARLAGWGEALEFPDADRLADDVVAAIEPVGRRGWRVALAAAAAVLLVVAVIVGIPDSRRAVARWLGLERLEVRVVDQPPEPSATGLGPRFSLDGAAAAVGVTPYVLPPLGEPVAAYAPGGHYVAVRYDDGGTVVLVATLPGRLFHKEVAMGAQAEPLEVRGVDGLWVSGAPHQLVYEEPGGDVVQSRMSADTLVWQEGDVIVRIEGDIGRQRALELAAAVVPADGP
jgi:hypothetical protein